MRISAAHAACNGLRCLVLLAACMASAALAQKSALEVITLRYRAAEQVIPVLRPLLDKNGTLSGMQNQLIVRTTRANLAEIKRVLEKLDAVPRRLMITVRQDAAVDRDRAQADVSGRIRMSGGNASVIGTGRIDGTRSLDADRNTQTLQVLEGSSAFIRMGQSVPVQQPQVQPAMVNGKLVGHVGTSVEYRDVTSGFYALPRLAGDRVTLEIKPQRDTLSSPEQNLPPGSVNVQQAETTVSGRLGEWIEVAGVVQGMPNQQAVILGSTRDVSGDNRRILLKVDEIR